MINRSLTNGLRGGRRKNARPILLGVPRVETQPFGQLSFVNAFEGLFQVLQLQKRSCGLNERSRGINEERIVIGIRLQVKIVDVAFIYSIPSSAA